MKLIKLLMILAILVTFISGLLPVTTYAYPVSKDGNKTAYKDVPGWYDTNWAYRKTISITGSTSAQTDYQVRIPVNFVSGHMNADFSDIRFVAADGTTVLNYWTESYTASTNAVFWVKIPLIPTAGTTIYMYYGNPNATSASNGENTFIFFDDFSTDKLAQYTSYKSWGNGGRVESIENGMLKDADSGANADESVYFTKNSVQLANLAVDAKLVSVSNKDAGRWQGHFLVLVPSQNSSVNPVNLGYWHEDNSQAPYLHMEGGTYSNSDTSYDGTGKTLSLAKSGNNFKAYVDGQEKWSFTDTTLGSNNFYSGMINGDASSASSTSYWDDFRIRNYTLPEPVATLSSEAVNMTNWQYHKAISITGSDAPLTDYQVRIPVNFIAGHMNTDFSDIRFIAMDGTTALNYWMESATASTSAVFWVKVPSITTTGTTIYMYYGNSNATSTSNGENTFVFFDGFDDGTIATKWTQDNSGSPNSISEAARSGYLRVQTNNAFTDWWTNAYSGPAVRASCPLSDNFEIVTKMDAPIKQINTEMAGIGILDSTNTNSGFKLIRDHSGTDNIELDKIGYATSALGYTWDTATANIYLKIGKNSNWYAACKTDGGWVSVAQWSQSISNINFVLFEATAHGGGTLNADFDWIYVRSIASTEPAVTVGNDEAGRFQLTLAVNGNGTTTPSVGSYPYNVNEAVTITATPAQGWEFVNWTGDVANNNAASTTVTMNMSKTITAHFIQVTANWYSGWTYRKAIVIDHTKVANTDQTNFPVLISRTDNNLRTVANGGHVGQADGGDIVFTSADGSTKLSHEIEKYDPATGQLIAWVKIPALSASADTVIYLYYGNAACAGQWAADGSTWDTNYKMVQHLEETSGTVYDSTANGNNGTPNGGVVEGAAGKIGNADTFDGVDDYIQTTLAGLTTSYTLEAWVNSASSGSGQTVLGTNIAGRGDNYFSLYVRDYIDLDYHPWPTAPSGYMSLNAITRDQWQHVVVTFTPGVGTSLKTYANGTLVSGSYWEGDGNTPQNNTGDGVRIGALLAVNNALYFTGSIDEVRISSIIRSADWIATEYNNQNSPATFFNAGTEEIFKPVHNITTGNNFATIQSAIDASDTVNGNTITVEAGTYTENVDFKGKNITLRSVSGAASTIINGGHAGSCVKFVSGEISSAVLDGFTLTNGTGAHLFDQWGTFGGGIAITNSSNPTITNCVISGNSVGDGGAGIYLYGANATIKNSIITGNSGGDSGGIDDEFGIGVTIISSIIAGNSGWYCSGVRTGGGSYPNIINSTIVGNQTSDGSGGICSDSNSGITLVNSIIWGNLSNTLNGNITATYSDIQGGFTGTGNIDADPLFVNAGSGNYHLQTGSPCINVGNNAAIPSGITTDFEGDPRVNDGTVDMGADETIVYALTIAKTGNGTVAPSAGTHTYAPATQVNLVATPTTGNHFVHWTGDVSTIANVNSAATTVTINGDYTITANFAATIVPTGGVSYWSFDETGGSTAYDSWTGNDGALNAKTNVLAHKAVTADFQLGFGTPGMITDCWAPGDGTSWDSGSVQLGNPTGSIGHLTVDIGTVATGINRVVVQCDHNDDYLVEYSLNGTDWLTLYAVPQVGPRYLQTRDSGTFTPVSARYIRISATGGDGLYSVSELQVFGDRIPSQTWIAGESGNALSFNGAGDYVQVPNATSLNITGEISVEAWINPARVDVSDQSIVSRGGGWGRAGCLLELHYNQLQWIMGNDSTEGYITSATTISPNVWTHVAAVWKDGVMNVYINGNKDANSATWSSGVVGNSYDCFIGRTDGTAPLYYQGLIDEAKVYSRALTVTEIRTDAGVYTLTTAVNGAGTVSPASGTCYAPGTAVNLVATPTTGNHFVNWTGNVTTVGNVNSAATTVTINGDYTITANFATTIVPTGGVSYWSFDETGGSTAYDSWGANNGTLVNNPARVDGEAGNALNFDGADWGNHGSYVAVPDSASLRITDQITLSAWVYRTAVAEEWNTIVSKPWVADYNPWHVYRLAETGYSYNPVRKPMFSLGLSSGYAEVDGTTEIQNGQWMFIVGTYDGSTMKIYVNGVLEGSAAVSGTLNEDNQPVFIGTNGVNTWNDWFGKIDEVKIYNRALTENEVRAEAGLPPQNTLTLAVNGNGSVTPTAGEHAYNTGEVVNLTAVPDAGYHFVNWTGDTAGVADVNNPTTTVTMSGDYAITANFTANQAPTGGLNWWKFDEDSGNVAYDSWGASNGVFVGQPTRLAGKSGNALSFNRTGDYIQLPDTVAHPASQISLEAWVKVPSDSAQSEGHIIEKQKTLYDSYALRLHGFKPQFILNNAYEANNYTITCPTTINDNQWHHIAATYDGTTMRLYVDGVLVATGTSMTGNIFYEGTVGPRIGFHVESDTYFSGMIDEVKIYNRALTANEIRAEAGLGSVYYLNITVNPAGGGTVAKSVDQTNYSAGTMVRLTANPAEGWVFSNWSGDVTGNANPLDVTMNSDRNITANFVRAYTLTVGVNTAGSGTVTKSPDQANYTAGAIVQLSAIPTSGWTFVGWSGDAGGNTNPLDVTMNSSKNITANFVTATPTISVILQNPTLYAGRQVQVSGLYRGWESGHGSPPVTRSDWVLQDDSGTIYVSGSAGGGLSYPDDAGKTMTVTGIVRVINGQAYIEVPRTR